MKNLIYWILSFALLACQTTSVQDHFEEHITYLASDDLEGRETGSEGERMAARYIQKKFEETGLKPGFGDEYLQPFEFLITKEYVEANHLFIGEHHLEADSGYFPLNYSANATAQGKLMDVGYGITAPELDYDDLQNNDLQNGIALIRISSPDGIHPHSKYLKYHDVRERIKKLINMGIIGVVLINDDPTAEDPKKNYDQMVSRLDIPVVFVKDHQLLKSNNEVSIKVNIKEVKGTGNNVVGVLDNNSDNYIIIGAHYDHLGYGDKGSSLYRGEQPEIHNGADDNASGTAMIIELARSFKERARSRYNYVFIAFSGEEKGLLGANYFTENAPFDLDKVNYMLNFDMVGRIDTTDNKLAISGIGTSPTWDSLLQKVSPGNLSLSTSSSGVGPSDHTAFYFSDIPVLHFFSGTHEDYHKPSDDVEKINYNGMESIYHLVNNLCARLDDQEKIAFSKTKDDLARTAPRFTVTLGIVPDYLYDKKGLKIDGVTEGKPAAIGSLQKGDVITRLGAFEIDDIYTYMTALSHYKKGDTTTVSFVRNEKTLSKSITF